MKILDFVAVVLTYNRPILLEENILAVLKQTVLPKELIIIDNNSSLHTQEVVNKYQNNGKLNIRYHKLENNFGSAGGFYYAIKFAYDLGCEYILTMDDDGKPYNNDTFEVLNLALQDAVKKNQAVIIGPLVTYDGVHITFGPNYSEEYIQKVKKSKNLIYKNYISPYNGTIISRKCIEKIGFPNKEFYMYGDEIDYMMRAKENEILLLTVLNAIYQHPKPNEKVNRFMGKMIISYQDASEMKQYYYLRNHYYALKIHKEKLLSFRLLVNRLIAIVFFETDKRDKLRIFLEAISDANSKKIHDNWMKLKL